MKKLFSLYLLLAFTMCASTVVMSSCGDDEDVITDKPDNGNNGNNGNEDKPDNKDDDNNFENTEKADEGKIAFAKGTCLDMDVSYEKSDVLLEYKAAGSYDVKVNDDAQNWVIVYKNEDNGRTYTNVYIQENTGAARKAVITYSMGSYKKYVKINQRAKGETRPVEALPEYANTDFWHRTDREKMGLYGPVSYYRNTTYVGEDEYFFDREGHLIKSCNEEYTTEYTYDEKGRLSYYKVTGNDSGTVTSEYFYEYNNIGKLTLTLYSPGTNYLIPDLSHYRSIQYCPESQIHDETYTFDETGMTVVEYNEIKGYGYDQHFDDNTYHVEYNGAYPASYSYFTQGGEGRGFGPVEMFPNGMLKSYNETFGSVYGYDFRQDTRISFMDYAGAMLVTRFQLIRPEYLDNGDNYIIDLIYNDRKELKEVVRDNGNRITLSGYIYDKYGNWIHREVSDLLWGTSTIGGWDVTDRLIGYFE